MRKEPAPTLLTAELDRGLAIARHALRRAAYQLVADCECMLEALHHAGRQVWYEQVMDALVAARQVQAAVADSPAGESPSDASEWLAAVEPRTSEARRRVVQAMSRVMQFVALTPIDELLLKDARAIRTSAEGLLKLAVASRGEAQENGTRPSGQAAAVQRPRVLVADDSQAQRDLLRRFLKRLDCDVVDARDGVTALGLAQHEHLDLIITDVNMPQLDGLSLLKELKASLTTRDIPVIVVSGEGGLESVVECIAHGAEDHLAKPYESTLLTARVKASLERKRMRDVEREYLRRVAQLTEAAKGADRDGYIPGSLDVVAAADDELGALARVFDRLVSGMRSREGRLKNRLVELRNEMKDASSRAIDLELVPDASAFTTGEMAGGRYRVIGQIGSGGMGMVYRAKDMELNEDVALKVVRRNLVTADPNIVTRLKSEVRLARKISHRNVARTHDFGEWDGTYFISMEYVEGISVSELLDRRGRLSISSTLAIGTQLTEALAVAHEQQIVHRDIKPANLIVDNAGVLKVMDFGIAKSTAREEGITLGGFVVGTPHYMAPEQLVGGMVDARSDLYAVGVVLYECLTGRTPYEADSEQALMAQLSAGAYMAVGELVRDVPRDLEALIHQQLHFRPQDRIASARDLAQRLSEIEHHAESVQ